MTRWQTWLAGRDHRESASRALAISACLLLILSALILQPGSGIGPETGPGIALPLLVLGGIVLGVALRLTPHPIPLPAPSDESLAPTRIRWPWVILGALALGLPAEINGGVFHIGPLAGASQHVQFALFCAGIALLVWGVGGAAWPLHLPTVERREALGLLAITALALALRLWQLEDAVHRLIDEIHYVDAILRLSAYDDIPLLTRFSVITSFTWLFPYLQTRVVDLMGPSLISLRLMSAIMGTLTVPALYALARALFDRKTAWIAALILATFPPHLHFSRLGINNVADPLFGTLALCFLARGWQTRRGLDYALAGALLGLTQYFYEGGRLLYPALVVLWLAGVALTGSRRHVRGAGIALLLAAALAAPLYYTLLAQGMPFLPRMDSRGLDAGYWSSLLLATADDSIVRVFLQHVTAGFSVYVHTPNTGWFYNSQTPLILGWLAPAFLLGVWHGLWRWRAPGTQLLLWWIVLTSLGNSLLENSSDAARFGVVFPALALLIAVGIRHTLPLLWPHGLPVRRQNVLMGALVVLLAAIQTLYFFGPHLAAYNRQVRLGRDPQDAIFRALDFPPGTHVHVVGLVIDYEWDTVRMLAFWERDDLVLDLRFDADELTPDYFAGLPRDVDHAFFLPPEDAVALARIRAHFHVEGPTFSPFNIPPDRAFALYYASRPPGQGRPAASRPAIPGT